jgi:hypothetical protein
VVTKKHKIVDLEEMRSRLHRFGFSCAGLNVSEDIASLLDEVEALRSFTSSFSTRLKDHTNAILEDDLIAKPPFEPTFARGFASGLTRAVDLFDMEVSSQHSQGSEVITVD